MRRAAHQLLDSPRVFDDPLALRIIGAAGAAALRADPRQFEGHALAPYLRASLAVRSRFAEDTLAELVPQGVRQYVILGAGLDTFAYRSPYPALTLRVFEVDHPATQTWKRQRLVDERIEAPPGLVFVPMDFEAQTLPTELARAGLNPAAPTFFSWLGVTPYLKVEAVLATLQQVLATTRQGGGIVFDYGINPKFLGTAQRAVFDALAARVAAAGEPWKTFFEPADLGQTLRDLGFRDIQDWSAEDLNRRYLAERSDGLRVGSLAHIVKATIRAERPAT
ncbi:MAG: class I SAM-dependent methyltransferase [Desulfobacterales bacterium]|nr:class I SAM-dependent methyltransferase [Desulfobacterales bacterium]